MPNHNSNQPTAVIFGGAGFIGGHLLSALLQQGCRVTVADLKRPTKLPDGANFVFCDVREPITANFGPTDAIYNLAAVHRMPGHEPFEYYETNVRGATNITRWAADNDVPYICFVSSIAVYGPSEAPKSEDSATTPNSDYGRSKLLAEEIHQEWQAGAKDRKLIIVRPAVVFGAGEGGNFTRLAHALASRRFLYPGRPDVIKSAGYVGELPKAVAFVESLDESVSIFNFCFPAPHTISEICIAFNAVAGYHLPRSIPPNLVEGLMRVLKAVNPRGVGTFSPARIAKLRASTNIVPGRLLDWDYQWSMELPAALSDWQAQSHGRFD